MAIRWDNTRNLEPRGYVCWFCNHRVGPSLGWHTNAAPLDYIYLCSYCGRPTYFDPQGKQSPGVRFGNSVTSLPKDLESLYDEARQCMSVNSFTSTVLTCRKILMHIAVEKGAPAGKSFMDYVEYLSQQNYIPPDGKGWVDYIRKKGNEANHEIKVMSFADAADLITFLEMLLKFIYEFPAKVQPPPAPAARP